MVFRGKPSKACERCRARRLRCDLHTGTCGQCARASVACSGYRDTTQLRIHNESQSVVRKAMKKANCSDLLCLPLSINLQARDAFFAYYIDYPDSRCWTFLRPYYHPTDSPEHLTLALEAVSLAYLWHLVYSDIALETARSRYISALRLTNNALKSPGEAAKVTTLLASLLLDLFEKICGNSPQGNSLWKSHADGALALVAHRGLEQFRDPSDFHVLVRLSNHYLISSVANGSTVPMELKLIQSYVDNHLGGQEHTVQLAPLMARYAQLRHDVRKGVLSNEEYITEALDLELKLQQVELDMPISWQYSTIVQDHRPDTMYNLYYDLYYDLYPHRNICQAWNILRIVRILLSELVIECASALPSQEIYSPITKAARDSISTLVREICACVPQYVDCSGPARPRLPISSSSETSDHSPNGVVFHNHTPYHRADCYSLLFALYTAGRSHAHAHALPEIKPWIIHQLHHIGSHFYIRNAEILAQMLEQGTNTCPWEAYTILGSYAFNA